MHFPSSIKQKDFYSETDQCTLCQKPSHSFLLITRPPPFSHTHALASFFIFQKHGFPLLWPLSFLKKLHKTLNGREKEIQLIFDGSIFTLHPSIETRNFSFNLHYSDKLMPFWSTFSGIGCYISNMATQKGQKLANFGFGIEKQ